MKKKSVVAIGLIGLLILSGCGRSDITGASGSQLWESFVYGFASLIKLLSLGGVTGVGIILFTLLVRTALLPLMRMQMASSQKMQALQPEVNKLKAQYPGRDTASKNQLNAAIQQLYADNDANPYAGCLPALVQMPILFALYQALTRVPFLRTGHFLWFDIAGKDPLYILPILAAILTFASAWLTMKAAPEENGMARTMTYAMPVMILVFALNVASGVALYWTISNAYQVFQTMLFNNPFKIRAQRAAEVQREKDKVRARQKALKKAKRKK